MVWCCVCRYQASEHLSLLKVDGKYRFGDRVDLLKKIFWLDVLLTNMCLFESIDIGNSSMVFIFYCIQLQAFGWV